MLHFNVNYYNSFLEIWYKVACRVHLFEKLK